ncbi:MAG: DUF1294 domain-containing protein [Clostridiales bacterium]|nr:DUF1294 domain-containing protein [Clostridiales bacterium]
MNQNFFVLAAGYLLLVNGIAFFLMGYDKKQAIHHKWRVPEKYLFLPVILGGGIGGIAGMRVFHHKTRHWYFAVGFPAILLLEAVIACVLMAAGKGQVW